MIVIYEWQKRIQLMVDEIDESIRNHDDESLTLCFLSQKFAYTQFYITKKFREITGMQFRDYLRGRRLAFALKEVRDSDDSLLKIALDYGFSSHEAFSRAFKRTYGYTPSEYRKYPKPVVLRTKIHPFDRYFLGFDEIGLMKSENDIKIYFVTIPAHKFLHIRNYESNGYWDFWSRQSHIPYQDSATICGLLDSIKGKLDDEGGSESFSGSGQVMAYISDPHGRLCEWGFQRVECYGARLPYHYEGTVPSNMQIAEIPECTYAVFEHGPFDYEQENHSVERKIERAMREFEKMESDYCYDTMPGRILYLYYDPERYWKYIRPVRRRMSKDLDAVA